MTDLKPSFPSDSDVLTAFHEELARAVQRPGVLGTGPAVWPRFAAYYRGLARLWPFLVCFLMMLFLGTQAHAIDSDDLAMAVTASSDPVVPGGVILYQLTATNRGTVSTSGGVTVTAFIPGSTTGAGVSDGGICPGGVCNTGETVTWSLSNLPPGASRTVGLSVGVFSGSSAPPDGALIAQQAAVTSEGFSAFADRTVIVQRTPVLSLSMRADRDPLDPGAPLTYTLVFSNRGEPPASGVTLRALVPGGTSFQSADGGGTQSGGAVTWSLGTIGVGQSGERHFTVIVDAQIAGGELLLNDAEILDTAAASNRARSTTATAVNGNPRLALSLTAGPDPVAPGGVVLYQLTATNRGTVSTSGGVTVTAFVPGSTSGAGVTDEGVCPGGVCNTGEAVTWSLTDLPAGANRTVGLSVRVFSGSSAPPDGALIAQQAAVTSEGGSASAVAASRICAGGGTSCDLPEPTQADLTLTAVDSPDPVFVTQPLTYTLTVRNNGPNDATGVTVTDPLPGGVFFVSAAASQGNCTGTSTVTCTLGSLGNGASATITIVVSPLSPGALSNTASVSGSPSDPNPGNNSATSTTTVLEIPRIRADLALTQADAPDPGAVNDPLVYTLTATNHGPSPATGVQVTDNLHPSVVLTGPPIPSQGTCSGTGPVVCQLGTLASGASATVTLNVLPTQAGTVSNAASVVGVEPDIAPGNNSTSNTTTVNQVAVLPSPKGNCNRSRCGVRLTCTLGEPCAGRRVTLFVSARSVRGNEAAAIKATNPIKFAAGIANVPPGGTATVRLRPTSRARAIIRTSGTNRLRGFMEIRNTAGAVVSTTKIRIRLR